MSNDRLVLFPIGELPTAFNNLEFSIVRHYGAPRLAPLSAVVSHVVSLGCKGVVRQYPVQDPDYSAEYNRYYSKCFGNVGKNCHRFHFFLEEPLPGEDSLDYLDRLVANRLQDSYLGFLTVRPVRSSPVAATILKPSQDNHFLLSRDEFDVHLAGHTFSVRGTPFIQQDNAVGACAQASIWMALRTLRKREGNTAYDLAQITTAATRFLARGRTLPNREGLIVEQIVEAVRSAGYSSHILWLGDGAIGNPHGENTLREIKRKLYTYVESEIPVILGVYPSKHNGHAILLIGHGWDSCPDVQPYESLQSADYKIDVYHAENWVDQFFVNNDNSGPYQPLPLKSSSGEYALDQAYFGMPLLPSDVFMTGEEAELTAKKLLEFWLNRSMPPEMFKAARPVVLRTYLSERYRFREWVLSQATMSPMLKRHFRLKEMPKRIWVTEICLLEEYGKAHAGGGARIGEVVLDPTGEPNDGPFLSVHINISVLLGEESKVGILFDRNPANGDINMYKVDEDDAYLPLRRL